MDRGDEEDCDDPSCSPAKKAKEFKTRRRPSRRSGWKTPNSRAGCGVSLLAGKSDLLKHASTLKHERAARAIKGTPTFQESYARSKKVGASKHDEDVKKMETQLSAFFAEHNIAYQTAKHLVKVLKKGAPDSKIVQDMSLGRFKCSSIVRSVIAKTETEELVSILRKSNFSILIDESRDISNKKNMCVIARFLNPTSGNVQTRLLEMLQLDAHDCSAEALWTAFETCMNNHGIPIENIVGLACDNTSVMLGKNNSFWSRLKARCPWAVLLACTCHSSALISRSACATLPLFVESTLKGVYNYSNGSPKRSAELKDYQELYEEEVTKLWKTSDTRWLVLQTCIARFLEHYDSLTGFFRTTVRESPDREFTLILQDLNNPFFKAYLYFLEYVLGYFNEYNALFQSKDPLVHQLAKNSAKLLRKLSQNFIVPDQIGILETVNFAHPSNYVPLEQVYVGPKCSKFLDEIRLPSDKPQEQLKKELKEKKTAFKLKCLQFYVKAAQEIRARLPINEKIFQEMEFIDPQLLLSPQRRVTSLQDLSALCTRFQEKLGLDQNALAMEWRTIPAEVDEDMKKILVMKSPPEAWALVKKMTNYDDQPMFPMLSKLADVVMTLPHSNAESERSFSVVTDVKTKKKEPNGCGKSEQHCSCA